jgi:hypothetical protein
MALLSNTNYYSNAIVGTPGVGSDIDLYASHSAPKYQVGFGFVRGDGNKYHYGQFTAIANRGTLVAPVTTECDQTEILKAGALVANLTKQGGEIMNPNAIGSRYAQLIVSASANQFAGGYLTIASGTGFGFTYRIKGNDTTANQVTGSTFLNLYDPIVVALDSNSCVTISSSRYAALTPATTLTATCASVAGVTVSNNSANSYGWICTGGKVGVLQDINIGISGKPVGLSTTTAGSIMVLGSTVTVSGFAVNQIGYVVQPGSSAEYSIVYLNLD